MLWAICICFFLYYLIFRQSDVVVIQEKMLSFEIWHPTNVISTRILSIKKHWLRKCLSPSCKNIDKIWDHSWWHQPSVHCPSHGVTHNMPRFNYSQLFWVQNIQKTILSKIDWSSLLSWKQNTNSYASYNLNLQWPNWSSKRKYLKYFNLREKKWTRLNNLHFPEINAN